MELAEFFASKSINGIAPDEWGKILREEAFGMHALTLGPGVIRIDDASGPLNNQIIGCVKNYYTTDENGKKIRLNGSSKVLQCYKTKEELGVLDIVGNGSYCTSCHQACLAAANEGRLHRVVKKKR